MSADTSLRVVWWLWLVPAILALPLPFDLVIALCTRGWGSVQSSGIGRGGFAIVDLASVVSGLSALPLAMVSLLYVFLFWRHRERGLRLSARYLVPIYGSVAFVMIAMVLWVLASPA
jgi:hypothetical protein